MNGNFEPKKFGADKIAFLGMFALSLLIAQLIVSRNSALNFSEPIELAHSGLSISVPTGKGWQSELQWQYHSNGFTLSSHFIVGPGISGARVRCRYFPTSLATTAEVLFEQQAAEIKGTIKETGQSQKDNLTIYWARIEGPVLAFVGTVELPNNRTVNIEVIQTTFEINLD